MTIASVFQKVSEFVEDKNQRGIADWLFSQMGSARSIPPYTEDTYFAASKVHDLCPRMETIRALHDVHLSDEIGGELQFIFDVGKLYHHLYRDWYLGPKGVYLGKWRCLACEWTTDGNGTDDELDGGVPTRSFCPSGSYPNKRPLRMVPMPDKCPGCGAPRFRDDFTASGRAVEGEHSVIVFDEWMMVNEEHKIRAKSDGWRRSIVTGEVFNQEIKSISAFGFGKVQKTGMDWKPEHKTQSMVVTWMAGLKKGEVIYMNKAGWKSPQDIIHTCLVELDRDYIDGNVLKPIKIMRDNLRAGTLAPKLSACASKSVPRAKRCPMADLCFKRGGK